MKTKFLLTSFIFIAIFSFAQTKNNNPITEKIKVWGNCEMCKNTIEKSAKKAGASYALWNADAKLLTVKFNTAKTSNKKIQETIAAAGYDTQDFTAPDEAYNNLHECCKYERKVTTTVTKEEATTASCCNKKDNCKEACAKTNDKQSCATNKTCTTTCCSH